MKQISIEELELRFGQHLESLGQHLKRTSSEDHEDLGLHVIIDGNCLNPIEIESFSRAVGILEDDGSLFEWY